MANTSARNLNYFQRFTYSVVTYTELFFYKLGFKIGHKPIATIVICWGVVILSAFGFLRFHQEKNPLKLWAPPNTGFVRDSEWLMKIFQRGFRMQIALFTDDDVLRPEILKDLAYMEKQIRNSKTNRNVTWNDVCFQIPKLDKKMLNFLESGNKDDLDPSVQMNAAFYCSFVESMKNECLEKSILDLWDFNLTVINSLTKEDILRQVNSFDKDSIYGSLKNVEDLLGHIERNSTGHIVGAKALHNIWMINVNFTSVDMDKVGNRAGTADWVSEDASEWELEFSKIMENVSQHSKNTFAYISGRSFGDLTNATMFQDMDLLVLGVFIMIIYVQFVISKFNWLESRIVLGFMGLLAIGMAFVVGCGICSLLGVYYGPVHTSLPFLLMGLGIDDMLVILACWDDLSYEQRKQPLPERVGLMLKHGGVSITVTSVTDIVAFLIGSYTILPCLESFCIYAAFGVLMTFIFAVTFFTACFVLDQKRLEMGKSGVIPCYQLENYKPNQCSQQNLSNRVFEFVYSKIILTVPGKIVVIIITVVCFGFGMDGLLKLEQRFDPTWFVPKGSHLSEYLDAREIYFPTHGFEAGIYMGAINYTSEISNIRMISDSLKDASNITDNVLSWVDPFRKFVLHNFKHDIYEEPLSEDLFNLALSKFLFSPRYARFQANFRFEKDLECGIPVSKILMSSIEFNFLQFHGPKEYLPAMHRINDIVKNANFTTGDKFITSWSKIFATWITDEVIDVEVMRNLELALICVMACTILLIADLQTCCWIFLCVLITMVDVCGFMQKWGLTIDLVSCIGLELAIGLCVDYAAHVGHTFLTIQKGTRTERSLKTVKTIGSAVLFGGISTFIGVFMLSQSEAYTFQTFFKIFFLVIVFGLFHGVVLLPVIFSWIGPSPYRLHEPIQQSDREMM